MRQECGRGNGEMEKVRKYVPSLGGDQQDTSLFLVLFVNLDDKVGEKDLLHVGLVVA